MPNIPSDHVSHEMAIIIFIIVMFFSSGIGIIVFFVRRWFIKSDQNDELMLQKLDFLRDQRVECMLSLPVKYADKADTLVSLEKLNLKTENHENRLSVIETKIGRRFDDGVAPI